MSTYEDIQTEEYDADDQPRAPETPRIKGLSYQQSPSVLELTTHGGPPIVYDTE